MVGLFGAKEQRTHTIQHTCNETSSHDFCASLYELTATLRCTVTSGNCTINKIFVMAADAGDTCPAKPIPTTKATPNTRALPEVIKDVFFFVIFIDFRYTICCSLCDT